MVKRGNLPAQRLRVAPDSIQFVEILSLLGMEVEEKDKRISLHGLHYATIAAHRANEMQLGRNPDVQLPRKAFEQRTFAGVVGGGGEGCRSGAIT